MRRTDRQITDFEEIAGILRRADSMRLGINGAPYPYVAPLSFGMEAEAGKITLYFHGAKAGLKHELLAADPHVCVEADIFHGCAEAPGGITAKYESFIGFGKAVLVHGEEAARGMDLLLAQCGFEGYVYSAEALDAAALYKIELESFTGKRNL